MHSQQSRFRIKCMPSFDFAICSWIYCCIWHASRTRESWDQTRLHLFLLLLYFCYIPVIHYYLRFHRSSVFMGSCTKFIAANKESQWMQTVAAHSFYYKLFARTTAICPCFFFAHFSIHSQCNAAKRWCLTLWLSTPFGALCRRKQNNNKKSLHIFCCNFFSSILHSVCNFIRHFYESSCWAKPRPTLHFEVQQNIFSKTFQGTFFAWLHINNSRTADGGYL